MAGKLKTKAETIDEYLAALGDDQRAALRNLRKTIRAAAPKAEECISYQLAAFRHDGSMLVAFGARPNHCAFYLMSSTTLEAFKDELAGYDVSKGTIRFPAHKPLPAALVRKLVKARLVEKAAGLGNPRKPPAAAKNRATKPARKHTAKLANSGSQTDPAVIEFLRKLEHPRKQVIEAVRQIILGVSPEIREGIKWNSPSFRSADYFATLNLRARGGEDLVWLILHTGAKAKGAAAKGLKIADPAGLLDWLAKDRCLVTFADEKDVLAKRGALRSIIRAWIRQL